jgi:hypothetical protein
MARSRGSVGEECDCCGTCVRDILIKAQPSTSLIIIIIIIIIDLEKRRFGHMVNLAAKRFF